MQELGVLVPAALERTTDGGETWTRTEQSAAVDRMGAIAFAPSDPSIVYAASDNHVLKSTDGGATFVSTSGATDPYTVIDLEVDPFNASIVYALATNFLPASPVSAVFKTIDGGQTWLRQFAANIDNQLSEAIAIDPSVPSNLYLATRWAGVFRSTDSAATWSAVNDGLLDLNTRAIAVDRDVPGRVYVGTYASSVFVRDFPQPCPANPDPLCTTPATRGAALKVRSGAAVDTVVFKWAKGPAVEKGEFGTPNDGTGYTLCLYDQTSGGSVVAYAGRALPPCKTSSCWKETTRGWVFKSSGGEDGVKRVVLKSGAAGRAKLQVKASGPLALGSLPFAKSPSVVAEIHSSDGGCWGATFTSALKNTSAGFKARSD